MNGDLLVYESCGADLSAVTVTIDGELASLSMNFNQSPDPLFVSLSPAPEVGQTVEIDRRDPEFAPDLPTVSLEVVEADMTAPVLSDLVVEISDPPEGDSCSDPQGALARISASVDETSLDDGTRFEFSVTGDDKMLGSGSVGRFYLQPENTTAGYSMLVRTPVDEICVQVTAIDAAGNRSETLEDCVEGTGAAASAEDGSGCGCRAEPASPGERWAGLFGFATLAGWGLRSRRRAAARPRR